MSNHPQGTESGTALQTHYEPEAPGSEQCMLSTF